MPHGGQCSGWRVCLTVGSVVGGVCAAELPGLGARL